MYIQREELKKYVRSRFISIKKKKRFESGMFEGQRIFSTENL